MELLLLQTPLDATVFLRCSAAIAGSLCAWLAVLTAALSLWRIRSSGSMPPSSASPSPPAQNPIPKPISPQGSFTPACNSRFTAYYAGDEAAAADLDPGFGWESLTSVRRNGDEFDDDDEVLRVSDLDPAFGWESLMPVRRKGDGYDDDDKVLGISDLDAGFGLGKFLPVRRRVHLGWYRYQDLTVLNGSVVRLWNVQG